MGPPLYSNSNHHHNKKSLRFTTNNNMSTMISTSYNSSSSASVYMLLLQVLLVGWICTKEVHGWQSTSSWHTSSLYRNPSTTTSTVRGMLPSLVSRQSQAGTGNSDIALVTVRRPIRSHTCLQFQKDDDFDFSEFENDEEEEEEEESDDDQLQFMATFLANRLGRTLLTKQRQKQQQQQQVVTAKVPETTQPTTTIESDEENPTQFHQREGDRVVALGDEFDAQGSTPKSNDNVPAPSVPSPVPEPPKEPEPPKVETTAKVKNLADVQQILKEYSMTFGRPLEVIQASIPNPEIPPLPVKTDDVVKEESPVPEPVTVTSQPIIPPPPTPEVSETSSASTTSQPIIIPPPPPSPTPEPVASTETTIPQSSAVESTVDESVILAKKKADEALHRNLLETRLALEKKQRDYLEQEQPSQLHKREGDRLVTLQDDFNVNVPIEDTKANITTDTSSLDESDAPDEPFGRPLEVAQTGLPPLRNEDGETSKEQTESTVAGSGFTMAKSTSKDSSSSSKTGSSSRGKGFGKDISMIRETRRSSGRTVTATSSVSRTLPLALFHRLSLATRVSCSWSSMSAMSSSLDDEEEEPDLFEYFDPLLSPHAYPNGISPENKPEDADNKQTEENDNKVENPFLFSNGDSTKTTSSFQEDSDRRDVDTDFVFDPTLSPHEYANGTPSVIVGDKDTKYVDKKAPSRGKVGILLMDHGSRNKASNQRLQDMAKLYEQNLGSSRVVVRAAHMEIATPSIEDGMAALLEIGVDEIICHPYFLSPGRHVKEDIPRIVQSAIESLGIDIPVLTTEPVGSSTDVMIGAIHSLVVETSDVLDNRSIGSP